MKRKRTTILAAAIALLLAVSTMPAYAQPVGAGDSQNKSSKVTTLADEQLNTGTDVGTGMDVGTGTDGAEDISGARIDITNLSYNKLTNYDYTGKHIMPAIIIKNKEEALQEGKDYTLTYSNNLYPGKATVVVKGIGSYTGTYTRTFYVLPTTPNVKIKLDTGAKTKAANYKRIRVTWAKIPTANYQARYKKDNGKYNDWINIGAHGQCTGILPAGHKYTWQVRSYVKVGDNQAIFSKVSKGQSIYTLSKVNATVSKSGKKAIVVKWNNIPGETGYQVYRKTGTKGKWVKVATLSAKYKSWTNKNCKAGTTYSYKVRAYKTEGSTNVYAPFSSVKKLKLAK